MVNSLSTADQSAAISSSIKPQKKPEEEKKESEIVEKKKPNTNLAKNDIGNKSISDA